MVDMNCRMKVKSRLKFVNILLTHLSLVVFWGIDLRQDDIEV